ncbi:hypothetical protein AT239_05170 [Bartonella henselae]|nr:hypothetical protein AT239_05170 [Bartonella henselae]
MKKINYLYKSISCYEDAPQIVTGLEAKFGIANNLSQEIKHSPMHSLKKIHCMVINHLVYTILAISLRY